MFNATVGRPMTHKPKPQEGVTLEMTANERYPHTKDNQEMHMLLDAERNRAAPGYGISDITARVDARSKAVLAAEEFAACEVRCHMLHGQWLAELNRLKELSLALDNERDLAVKRVQDGR